MRLASALVVFSTLAWQAPAQVLTLQDGTPVRLRLMRSISSADAKVGDTVDFEVTEPVINQNVVVIQKGSIALGKVTKAESKRRFGRAGELEISVDSVRLADGSRAALRASSDKGTDPMGGARVAATIAASPVLVWVHGKDVSFAKGTETTAYLNGDVHVDEAKLLNSGQQGTTSATPVTAEGAADRVATPGVLTNNDIIQMKKAGLSDDLITTKIKTSSGDYRTGTQDLIQLKDAGLSDQVISLIMERSKH